MSESPSPSLQVGDGKCDRDSNNNDQYNIINNQDNVPLTTLGCPEGTEEGFDGQFDDRGSASEALQANGSVLDNVHG